MNRRNALRRSIGFGIALGFAGLGINCFPAPFPVLDSGGLYLGVIPYLLVAMVAGPWTGVLSAGIASSVAVWSQRDPILGLAMCLEAGTIGWLVRRGNRPLSAAIAYWSVVGTRSSHWECGFGAAEPDGRRSSLCLWLGSHRCRSRS